MIALLVSRQLGLHAATRLDKHSLDHSLALVGCVATLALTLLTYAYTAVSQVVHVRLPHLAHTCLPVKSICWVLLFPFQENWLRQHIRLTHVGRPVCNSRALSQCKRMFCRVVGRSRCTVSGIFAFVLRIEMSDKPEYRISVSDVTCCKGRQGSILQQQHRSRQRLAHGM